MSRPSDLPLVVDIEIGPPADDEVLVEMRAAGICHTDLDVNEHIPDVLLGHEGAGIVRAVGDAVTNVAPDDHVILNWAIPCFECPPCHTGRQHLCEAGPLAAAEGVVERHARISSTTLNGEPIMRSFNLGTMATHTLVKSAAAIPIDPRVPFAAAAIMGCGVMTGYGSAVNVAKVSPGSHVVVLGAGGVGINAIQGARLQGAARTLAVDIDPAALKRSRSYGATDTMRIRPSEDLARLHAGVVEILGRAADYAFEATAVPALAAAPLAVIRNGGTAVQLSGVERSIVVDMSLFEWDKIYINPLYGACQPLRDFPLLIERYIAGDLLVDEQITGVYRLEEVAKAFDDVISRRTRKAVIAMPASGM